MELKNSNALDKSREWRKNNESIGPRQVLADFGITQEESERHNKAR